MILRVFVMGTDSASPPLAANALVPDTPFIKGIAARSREKRNRIRGPKVPANVQEITEPMPDVSAKKADEVVMMFCVKKGCRCMRAVTGPEKVMVSSGRHALKGECPICGTTTFKFIASPKV